MFWVLGDDLLPTGAVVGWESHEVGFAKKIFSPDADKRNFAVLDVAADGAWVRAENVRCFQ